MYNFPGLQAHINKVVNQVGNGITPPPSPNYQVRPFTFWHRLGISDPDDTCRFFGVNKSSHVTNWNGGNNGLPNNNFFWLTGVSLQFEYGWNVAGAAVAANIGFTAAGTTPGLTFEALRGLIQSGQVTLKVGGQEVFDVYGCYNFPAGGGLVIHSHSADSDNATGLTLLNATNGIPANWNVWQQTPWYPIPPQKEVDLSIDWQHGDALPGAIVVTASLRGLLISQGFRY